MNASISPQKTDNFRALANYLWGLPDDYEYFHMGFFLAILDTRTGGEHSIDRHMFGTCGTVACALGHSIAAGVVPPECVLSWRRIAEEFFDVHEDTIEWSWCFDSDWQTADNTPKGAARRIYYMLRNGVPKEFEIYGEEEDYARMVSFYEDMTPETL